MSTITNYGFVIDNRKCIGCHACTVACKAEHGDPIGVNKTWVKYIEKGEFPDTNRRFSVLRCNHCADSPCTDVCPVTALWEREDGIVDFDTDRCIGCKACMQGCPYDALYIDPETETAAKCNYCSHRVDSGREPACVTVCPEDAIIAGDLEGETEISRVTASQEVQIRKPEKGTDPNLYYVDGDDASLTPGSTDREEHYMWSDAPTHVETRALETEEFDLERAAESLARSDVDLEGDSDLAYDPVAASDGGQATASDAVASSDGDSNSTDSRTDRAAELLRTEARRVYDVGETHYASWGWEVYAYTWTKSIAAGALLVPALLALTGVLEATPELLGASALVGGVFLALTGVLLILDLEQPARFHWVLLRPNWNSWLVRGAYVISAYGALIGLLVVGWLVGLEAITHPAVLAVAGVLAAATAVYTAFLLGASKGRDLWQSPALAIHMFVQAIVAGAGTTALLGVVAFDALVGPSRLALAAGLVAHLAIVGSEILTPHGTEDAEEAADRIVRGRFSSAFWGGGVAIGIAVPLAILAASSAPAAIAAAGVLALAGLLAFEYCWIIAPQTVSLA